MGLPKFFVDKEAIRDGIARITGDDMTHITRVLRKSAGDELIVCDGAGTDYICEIIGQTDDAGASGPVLELAVRQENRCAAEPSVFVTLYQALSKGDKMDYIIQKAVELGAGAIVPFESSNSVVRLDSKTGAKKAVRWQRIAQEAAKQCGRGIIPRVSTVMTFDEAIESASRCDIALMLYERESENRINVEMLAGARSVGVMIGSEGGFSASEVQLARDARIRTLTLGKRILRLETASVCVLSILMHETCNL